MTRRSLACLALVAMICLGISAVALAHEGETHVTASVTPVPVDPVPIGEDSPLIAALAAGGIVLVGGAGIYIYRLIKKGL